MKATLENINRNKITLTKGIILLVLMLSACSESPKKLRVATAANTQFAMEKIALDFTTETGIPIDLIISSSGKLTAQILAGAPYDLFISADFMYPEHLYSNGMTTKKPEVYALGQLALWSIDSTTHYSIYNLNQITDGHIAVPNPITAPYGIAAQEALETLNYWHNLEPRFVFGESVAQTNQYIISGAATIGFTATSIILSPTNQGKGKWTIVPDSLHTPIRQAAVLLQTSSQPAEAQQFYDYLFSKKASKTLASFGYIKADQR